MKMMAKCIGYLINVYINLNWLLQWRKHKRENKEVWMGKPKVLQLTPENKQLKHRVEGAEAMWPNGHVKETGQPLVPVQSVGAWYRWPQNDRWVNRSQEPRIRFFSGVPRCLFLVSHFTRYWQSKAGNPGKWEGSNLCTKKIWKDWKLLAWRRKTQEGQVPYKPPYGRTCFLWPLRLGCRTKGEKL